MFVNLEIIFHINKSKKYGTIINDNEQLNGQTTKIDPI